MRYPYELQIVPESHNRIAQISANTDLPQGQSQTEDLNMLSSNIGIGCYVPTIETLTAVIGGTSTNRSPHCESYAGACPRTTRHIRANSQNGFLRLCMRKHEGFEELL